MMPPPFAVVLTAQANVDISEAAAWYQHQRPGLGDEFIGAVRSAYATAADNPYRFARLPGPYGVRRVLTQRFPYRLFFVCHANRIVVIRVLHSSRSSRGWKSAIPTDSN